MNQEPLRTSLPAFYAPLSGDTLAGLFLTTIFKDLDSLEDASIMPVNKPIVNPSIALPIRAWPF